MDARRVERHSLLILVREERSRAASSSAARQHLWFFGNQVSATRPFEEAVHAPREWKPLPQRGATKPLLPIDSALSRRGFNFSEKQNPKSRIQNPGFRIQKKRKSVKSVEAVSALAF